MTHKRNKILKKQELGQLAKTSKYVDLPKLLWETGDVILTTLLSRVSRLNKPRAGIYYIVYDVSSAFGMPFLLHETFAYFLHY